MKKYAKCFAAALLFCIANPSAKAEGLYAAFDVGQTRVDVCNSLPWSLATGCKNTANIYRLAAGYQFTSTSKLLPMWGAEVAFADYGKASMGTFGVDHVGDWQISGVQVSIIPTLPLGDAFSITGKLGIARTDVKHTFDTCVGCSGTPAWVSTNYTVVLGIGALYDVTERVAIRAQYDDLGKVGDSDYDTGRYHVQLLTAGIIFKY